MQGVRLPICEKLTRTEFDDASARAPYQRLANPDGPEAAELITELVRLLTRYRNETPLGHQPHMIAHEADAVLTKAGVPTP